MNQDKPDIEKAGEAYKAFQQITSNGQLSTIDKKLLDMLDSKIKAFFCSKNQDRQK